MFGRRIPGLWHEGDFVRLWAAATVSMLGSFITRSALPFTAILVLGAGAPEVALIRGAELVAGLTLGLVAGAWIDRRRRRPVMVAADLGRAVLLGSIPLAALGGVLGLPQLVIVAFGAAVLTTFFDVADRAFLPTVVGRDRLVSANSTLTASGSAAEFIGFGAGGWLIQLLTAPIAIALDAVSFVVSAVLLGRIRTHEPAVIVPDGGHEPILDEIREGLRLTFRDPILRPLALGDAAVAAFWGVFGATYFVFATQLGFSPGVIGLVAAVGGASSFIGALAVNRGVRRLGVGRFLVAALVVVATGNLAIAFAPDASIVGLAFLLVQQLLSDSALTAFDVVAVSIRQTTVDDRALGRVGASMHVLSLAAMLVGTIVGGIVAATISVRAAIFVGGAGGFVAVAVVWFSRVRTLRDMPLPPALPIRAGVDVRLGE
ncbi:MAG TPA: MFS transporter [Candidatus Limnocylindrales bacterium]|nr:MFS transporter [Candidatus Limnocylindrales bacterium]